MATAGARRKDAALHVVEGTRNATKHGSAEDVEKAAAESKSFGRPVRPQWLKGHARRAWDRYIVPYWWIDRTREVVAIAFCELFAEFRRAPESFAASKHAQMRYCMQDLGLTDIRNRTIKNGEEKADEFFDK